VSSAIYEPKGAAREYAPLAVNLYRGCTHGCRYCYVPAILRMDREEFHARAAPRGVLVQLQRDAKRLYEAGDKRRVHLCFTCDPFPPGNGSTTREALRILGTWWTPVSLLTKAGASALHGLDVLTGMDAHLGTSLVWSDDERRKEWEPGAAPVDDRLELLRQAKLRGIPTWASVEPVIDPVEALKAIDLLMPVADVIKVGRWNHAKEANAIDWRAFAVSAWHKLCAAGKEHVFKRGLAELLPVPTPVQP
jgi:DNA repair photolyase